MNLEPEMDAWRKEWSSAGDSDMALDLKDIAAAAARYKLRSQLTLAAHVVFAVVLLASSLIIARQMHSREMVLWTICVWMTTLIACFLALEGWQKSRTADIQKVADYASFHYRRAVVQQWQVRAGAVFLAVQAAIAVVWLTTDLLLARIQLLQFEEAMIVLLATCGVFVWLLLRSWRRSKTILKTVLAAENVT